MGQSVQERWEVGGWGGWSGRQGSDVDHLGENLGGNLGANLALDQISMRISCEIPVDEIRSFGASQ